MSAISRSFGLQLWNVAVIQMLTCSFSWWASFVWLILLTSWHFQIISFYCPYFGHYTCRKENEQVFIYFYPFFIPFLVKNFALIYVTGPKSRTKKREKPADETFSDVGFVWGQVTYIAIKQKTTSRPQTSSQYSCFARLVIVGGHLRIVRKWRTSSIYVFFQFSREKSGVKSEKCIEYGK